MRCSSASTRSAFVAALLDDLQATVAIDRARVYATGISNGGMMAYEVACALADRIAGDRRRRRRDDGARSLPAVATGAGARHPRQRRSQPAARRRRRREGVRGARRCAASPSAIDFWRRHDGCGESARSEVDGAVRARAIRVVRGGSEVELVTIEGGGHSWPGGDRLARFLDPPSPALDATDEIWRFFARH